VTPLGNYPGAEPARGSGGDAARKDQLHLVGPAQGEVLAQDLLEKEASLHGAVQHLGERALQLQDRELVPVAGSPVRRRKRVWQPGQPLAQQGIDHLRIEGSGEGLHARRICTAQNAVVQGLESDPFLGQLALEVCMSVQT
jgi:hypothetical protein